MSFQLKPPDLGLRHCKEGSDECEAAEAWVHEESTTET